MTGNPVSEASATGAVSGQWPQGSGAHQIGANKGLRVSAAVVAVAWSFQFVGLLIGLSGPALALQLVLAVATVIAIIVVSWSVLPRLPALVVLVLLAVALGFGALDQTNPITVLSTGTLQAAIAAAAAFSLPTRRAIPAMVGAVVVLNVAWLLRLHMADASPELMLSAASSTVRGGCVALGIFWAVTALRVIAARQDQLDWARQAADEELRGMQVKSANLFHAARVLHDTVINTLAAIQLGVNPASADRLRRRCRADLDALSELSRGVQPSDAALPQLLVERATIRAELVGLPLTIEVAGNGIVAPRNVVDAIVGSIDEAINNASKYAPEAPARLLITTNESGIWVDFVDDGPGLAAAQLLPNGGIVQSILRRCDDAGVVAEVFPTGSSEVVNEVNDEPRAPSGSTNRSPRRKHGYGGVNLQLWWDRDRHQAGSTVVASGTQAGRHDRRLFHNELLDRAEITGRAARNTIIAFICAGCIQVAAFIPYWTLYAFVTSVLGLGIAAVVAIAAIRDVGRTSALSVPLRVALVALVPAIVWLSALGATPGQLTIAWYGPFVASGILAFLALTVDRFRWTVAAWLSGLIATLWIAIATGTGTVGGLAEVAGFKGNVLTFCGWLVFRVAVNRYSLQAKLQQQAMDQSIQTADRTRQRLDDIAQRVAAVEVKVRPFLSAIAVSTADATTGAVQQRAGQLESLVRRIAELPEVSAEAERWMIRVLFAADGVGCPLQVGNVSEVSAINEIDAAVWQAVVDVVALASPGATLYLTLPSAATTYALSISTDSPVPLTCSPEMSPLVKVTVDDDGSIAEFPAPRAAASPAQEQ